MTVGEKIKNRREELKMSQQQLADRMGFKDKTSISKIEKGKTKVDIDQAILFSKVLSMPIASFYADPSPIVNETISLMEIIDKGNLLTCYELFPRLSPSNQELIINIMKEMLK